MKQNEIFDGLASERKSETVNITCVNLRNEIVDGIRGSQGWTNRSTEQ